MNVTGAHQTTAYLPKNSLAKLLSTQPAVEPLRGARLRLALLLLRFCRLAFWPWEALRLREDWPRWGLLAAASEPSAARLRGAASAGAKPVAKTKPPMAARSKNFLIAQTLS